MPIQSQSSNSLGFSQLGLTQSVAGLTLTTTLYNNVTGQTTSSYIVPTSLSFIVGTDLGQTIVGSSYQTFTRGTFSLTTNTSRAVEISLIPSTSNGYIEFSATQFQNDVGQLRVLRGPSTVIGEMMALSELPSNTTAYVLRLPCSVFKFTDLTPISGAATYILQGNPVGTSSQIIANGALMMVRQI